MIILGKKASQIKSPLREDAVEDEAVDMFHQGQPQIGATSDSDFSMFSHCSLL